VRFLRAIGAIFLTAFLGACSGAEEATAQETVRSLFAESDSMTFGQFSMVGDDHACMTFNVKDATGEASGDQQAYLRRNVDGWSVLISSLSDHDACIENTKKLAAKRLRSD